MDFILVKVLILSVLTSKLFGIYVATMIVDNIMGYTNAWANGEFQSTRMCQGIVKHLTNTIITFSFMFFMNSYGLDSYASVIPIWFSLYNAISIIELCDAIGIPIPSWVKNGIKSKIEEIDKGDEDTWH